MIGRGLVSLDYARRLTAHRRLLLGCGPGRARSDLPRVATLGDWSCSSGQMRTPPPV